MAGGDSKGTILRSNDEQTSIDAMVPRIRVSLTLKARDTRPG
jgi:hypothetical protein